MSKVLAETGVVMLIASAMVSVPAIILAAE
jgi:hypothetical protein